MAIKARSTVDTDQRSILDRFTALLGAFRLKELRHERDNDVSNCLSTLFSSDLDFSCSVPSLLLTSLSHKSSALHTHGGEDKEKVEEHASSNLARPLVATMKTRGIASIASDTGAISATTTGSTSTGNFSENVSDEHVTVSEIPNLMLENLRNSFLTLTDARLRAYISILARHGVSLSKCPALCEIEQREGVMAVERKLEALIKVGTGLSIDNIVTCFHLDEWDGKGDGCVPLVLETTMDVCIPKICGGEEIVTIGASAKGSVNASFDSHKHLLTSVEVLIDTHELLAQLIDRASTVMSKALDIVRAVCALEPQFPPAPLPKHDLSESEVPMPKPVACQVSGQRALVSPEVEPKREQPEVTLFQLDETISNLSPQRCANIVDFVIGEVDHIIFPPFKRHKPSA